MGYYYNQVHSSSNLPKQNSNCANDWSDPLFHNERKHPSYLMEYMLYRPNIVYIDTKFEEHQNHHHQKHL